MRSFKGQKEKRVKVLNYQFMALDMFNWMNAGGFWGMDV
jgi:hypothetical protein